MKRTGAVREAEVTRLAKCMAWATAMFDIMALPLRDDEGQLFGPVTVDQHWRACTSSMKDRWRTAARRAGRQ
jgi:hypothetical protein